MIWLILLIGTILRFISINQSFWLDEADNVVAVKGLDFISFIIKYPIGDYHPPGYFALLWLWTHIFGYGEIETRILSVIFGVCLIGITYLLGRKIFNNKVAITAALLLALSPLHIYYSQEARMYSWAAFSVGLSYYFFLKLINKEKWAGLGYGISIFLLLSSDYAAYLIIPLHLFHLLQTQRKLIKKWLVILTVNFLIFSPWLLVFYQQFMEGSLAAINLPGWKKVAGGADLKNIGLVFSKIIFGHISFDNKTFYGFLVFLLGSFYALLIWKGVKKIGDQVKLLLGWFLGSLLLAITCSFFIPVLSYFRLLFIIPAFCLLVAKGLTVLPVIVSRISLACIIISSTIFIGLYYTNPQFQRENWRQAVEFFKNIDSTSSAIIFEDNHVTLPFAYYQNDLTYSFAGLKNIQAETMEDLVNLDGILLNKKNVYLFDYLVEITDPQRLLEKKITSFGFKKVNTFNFNGVGFVYLFTR